MKIVGTFLLLVWAPLLISCLNMPTPTSQITAAYNSGAKYKNLTCDELAIEMDYASRREAQLVAAQEQRIKTSELQGFLFGFGQGDGIEASELAIVRGDIEAIRRIMAQKGCEQ